MAVSTYNAIASVTLTTAQSEIAFTNIPQIYTDLVLVGSVIGSSGNDCHLRVNGDSQTSYSNTLLFGGGNTVTSSAPNNSSLIYGNVTSMNAGEVNTMVANFQNYSSSTTYKNILVRYNSTTSGKYVTASTALWRSLSAINSITVTTNATGNFAVGTTLSLYGVGANQLKASGGDIIVSDGTYWYHAFTSSGTFTPSSTLSCDVLVIAGGGGGTNGNWGGGSGAGGLRSTTSLSVSSATTVTVGAGGTPLTNGSDSIFSSITSSGGGYGGQNGGLANAGGSGGGASGYASAGTGAASSPVTSPVQGFAGGRSGYNGGNGGGGAGGAGVGSPSTPNEAGGNGGVGSASFSSWASITGTGIDGYYAGGGGGAGGGGSDTGGVGFPGIGGLGGGGTGANGGFKGGDGARNTGGGAGGTWGGGAGATGGSGLVIVRYAV